MSKQEREINAEPLGPIKPDIMGEPEQEFLVTRIFYSLGGANYFSGSSEQRGYYLSVTPVTRGKSFTSFGLFTGTKSLIQPAARFSAKTLAAIVPDPEKIAQLREHVLAKRRAKQVA